jgi:hypothetical protein
VRTKTLKERTIKPIKRANVARYGNKPAKLPPEQDKATGRFVTGNIGGPGRVKGTRRDIDKALVDSVCRKFVSYGDEAIDRVIRDDPGTFLKLAASLLPKEFNVNVSHDLGLDRLGERFRELVARASGGTPKTIAGTVQSTGQGEPDRILDLMRVSAGASPSDHHPGTGRTIDGDE